MPASHSDDYSPHPRGREIDFGTKDSGVHFTCSNHCIRKKRGALAFPESYAEVSDYFNEARRCGVEINHSGKSSLIPEQPDARG